MAHPVWTVGNQSPPITEQITVDGAAYDLSAATNVQFRMRLVGSDTLKVDAAATVTDAVSGSVSYAWQAADVDTAGVYLCWWVVTEGGKTQDVGEALIEFRAHTPIAEYVELEEMKSALQLQNSDHADLELRTAIQAACRTIDNICNRRFYLDADANQVRYFTPQSADLVLLDDLAVLTELAVDRDADATYSETWASYDYDLEPLNAQADGRPWHTLLAVGTLTFPVRSSAVRVTGQYGWPDVPAAIREAAFILSNKLMHRVREAPFGVVTLGIEGGVPFRIARNDPDVMGLVGPYVLHGIR